MPKPMLTPSHTAHIDGFVWSPRGDPRRNRIVVPSIAGFTEDSTGAKYRGATVSTSA